MKYLQYLLALSLLLLSAAPCWAARQPFGYVTVDIPKSWISIEEGVSVTLKPKDDSTTVVILAAKVDAADPVTLARQRATALGYEESICMLPDGLGFIATRQGNRYWLAVTEDWTFEIHVSNLHKNIPALITGIKAASDAASLGKAIALLQVNPKLVGWLNFSVKDIKNTVPLPKAATPSKPDFATYGIKEGETSLPPPLPTRLPQGWTAETTGLWVVCTSADSSQWVASRIYDIAKGDAAKEDGSPLRATAKELAPLLGGSNIRSGEGFMEFFTPEGLVVIDPKQGKTTTIMMFSNSDTTYDWYSFINSN